MVNEINAFVFILNYICDKFNQELNQNLYFQNHIKEKRGCFINKKS